MFDPVYSLHIKHLNVHYVGVLPGKSPALLAYCPCFLITACCPVFRSLG